ncbi:MAG: PQQ-binding-like beta-propeller repeat protein [Aeoliella sp.]
MRLVLFAILVFPFSAQAADWPQWRGPTGDNHAAAGATAPTEWSDESGLAWKTPVPGRGHSSPTVWGDRIYVTTCEKENETQSLLVLDRTTGELVKQTVAHEGKLPPKIHGNNTHASPTVACDGERVFALFDNDLAAWVTAFDLDGNKLWQERVAEFNPKKFVFGFGSSPMLVGDLLVVSTEYDGPDSGLYAIDTLTGKRRWHAPRPKSLSYSTPIAAVMAGKRQLVMSGNQQIAAYDPESGSELWSTKASTYATCGTMVWDAKLGLWFASGGFPAKFTCAVSADGDHEVVWNLNKARCYEQSLLAVDGYVYAVADDGIAHCFRGKDGEQMWVERLGGKFSSSPVLVDGKIYVTNEQGATYVFAASPESFESLGENQLGDECFATPTPVDGRLLHRFATSADGVRREYLAAIGE